MAVTIKPGKLLINNEWTEARSGKRFDVINPSTEVILTNVAEADKADVDRAVIAARRAFEEGPWKKMAARDRGRLLMRIAGLLDKNKAEIAEIETLNNGKPIGETLNVDLHLRLNALNIMRVLPTKFTAIPSQ